MSSVRSLIDQAFGEQKELCKRSHEAIAKHPQLGDLLGDVSQYIIALRGLSPLQGNQPSKKRKLDSGVNGTGDQYDIWNRGAYSTIKELSFTIPQRKKLNLDIGNATTGLRVKNVTTDEVEFAVHWQDVAQIVCLPVPEKAQAQYNFCVFPINGDGITDASEVGSANEQILWTVPNTTPKGGLCSDDVSHGTDETYKSIIVRLLNERLRKKKSHSVQIVEPDPTEFVSEVSQPYRKGEKAVHVKAFRGNKDGFLFFLPTGIFWGFKKPLIFFSFDSIDSVSYTSVLQRTFNLNISARGTLAHSEAQEYEFSMLDQGEFANISAYIKRHQLQDASMAEQRRAKKLNINGVKGEIPSEDQTDSPGELEKAAQEAGDLEDDEEEDDENFDPGSEGESEGSGTSDEEEDGDEPVGEGNDGEVDDTP
ncbi:MAG: hypothetical protein Q9195_008356 [Heterodermia aff. obscurata]